MKMKTFQADTMQEALAKVKEEMGPDAVILKSRKAARKAGGRTVACIEVTAALEETGASAGAGTAPRPSPRALPAMPPIAERRAPARASLPGVPERRNLSPEGGSGAPAEWAPPQRALAGRVPEDRTYDWRGSLRRVPGDGNPSAASGPADGGRPEDGLLELLRNELREVKDKVDMPTREIQVLKKEVKAMIESVAGLRAESRARGQHPPAQLNLPYQGNPGQAGLVDFVSPGALPQELRALHAYLLEMDLDADLAAELAFAAASPGPAAPNASGFPSQAPAAAGPSAAEPGKAALAQAMAARIRTTGGVRLRTGKPSVVALVGPTGAGKTTTLCKLAALAKMHQGKRVAILSADSFRMGANEQLELFGRTAGIPVRPLFSAADVAPALREFAACDLIMVDTAGRSHSHPEAWVELQNLLRAVSADEIHLVLSCTTRMRELIHQAGLYGNLCRLAPACGVVFTKLDECLSLGCLYNLARRLDAPVSYLCDGQVIPDHISLATPQSVAAKVLAAGKAREDAWKPAASRAGGHPAPGDPSLTPHSAAMAG